MPVPPLSRQLAGTLLRSRNSMTEPRGAAQRSGEARYRQIERYLRKRVERLDPGDALPTEAELCERFGVSRMTVRQAIAELVAAELVVRRRGRGTFVAARPLHRRPGVFLSFTEEMRRRGLVPSSRMVSAELSPATADERAELGLPVDADVVRIVRVRCADRTPIALEETALLPEFVAVLDADLAIGSLHQALRDLGTTAMAATGSVTARLAEPAERRQLGLSGVAALLVETRVLVDQHDRPFERTESRYVADRYVIDVTHVQP